MIELDSDYPELFELLVRVAEREFIGLCGNKAGEMAFAVAEYIRNRLGGTSYRLPTWKGDNLTGDLFSFVEPPRPRNEPKVYYTSEQSSNIDLTRFVMDTVVWVLATRLPAAPMSAIAMHAKNTTQAFHAQACGRDQKYIPKGRSYVISQRDHQIYKEHRTSNYSELALRYNLSEMRVRQIIENIRQNLIEKSPQSPLI